MQLARSGLSPHTQMLFFFVLLKKCVTSFSLRLRHMHQSFPIHSDGSSRSLSLRGIRRSLSVFMRVMQHPARFISHAPTVAQTLWCIAQGLILAFFFISPELLFHRETRLVSAHCELTFQSAGKCECIAAFQWNSTGNCWREEEVGGWEGGS